MSNLFRDEKFISIDFQTWETKYKPMEEELAKVKRELEEEKAKHTCTFNLSIRDNHYFNHRHWDDKYLKEKFVTISFDSFRWIPLTEEETNAGVREAEACINKALGNARFHGWIITEKEVNEALKLLDDKQKRIETLYCNNIEAVNRIPKFIKWLFKIKSI